jgi:hypothetical protein
VPLMWICLLGFEALTMNSGPMQVFGQQYFTRGSNSLDEAAAARYSLDGALCTRHLESSCAVLVFSEQLWKERYTYTHPAKMLFRFTKSHNKYLRQYRMVFHQTRT